MSDGSFKDALDNIRKSLPGGADPAPSDIDKEKVNKPESIKSPKAAKEKKEKKDKKAANKAKKDKPECEADQPHGEAKKEKKPKKEKKSKQPHGAGQTPSEVTGTKENTESKEEPVKRVKTARQLWRSDSGIGNTMDDDMPAASSGAPASSSDGPFIPTQDFQD